MNAATDTKQVTSTKSETAKAEEAKHPLMEFAPITNQSLDDWVRRWYETHYLHEKLGLLHYLSTEHFWQDPALVSLLLSVADGYKDSSNFRKREEFVMGKDGGASGNRRAIAEKAFAVLCLRFLRKGEGAEEPLWWWMVEHEELFKKVLWFLRLDLNCRLRNWSNFLGESSNHHNQIFHDFALDFAKYGWKELPYCWRTRYGEKIFGAISSRFVAARPQFISILDDFGELGWLNKVELDDESVKILTEMALGTEVTLPYERAQDRMHDCRNDRNPRNLAEALLGGLLPAAIVVLHRVKYEERKRFAALLEESERQWQEQQRLQRLAEIEKQKKDLDVQAKSLAGKR